EFDKLIEKEAKSLDKVIVNQISDLRLYKKENIKEFNSSAEVIDYLKSLASGEKVLVFHFVLKVLFPNLEDFFEKRIASSDLPKEILAIVIHQESIVLESFLTKKPFYSFDFDSNRTV